MPTPGVNKANRAGCGSAMPTIGWLMASPADVVREAVICPGKTMPEPAAFTRMPLITIDVRVAPPGVAGIAKVTEVPLPLTVPAMGGVVPAVVVTTAVGTKPGAGEFVIKVDCRFTLTLEPATGMVPVQLLKTTDPACSV